MTHWLNISAIFTFTHQKDVQYSFNSSLSWKHTIMTFYPHSSGLYHKLEVHRETKRVCVCVLSVFAFGHTSTKVICRGSNVWSSKWTHRCCRRTVTPTNTQPHAITVAVFNYIWHQRRRWWQLTALASLSPLSLSLQFIELHCCNILYISLTDIKTDLHGYLMAHFSHSGFKSGENVTESS